MVGARAKEFGAEHKHDIKPQDWTKFSDALDPNKARAGNLASTQKLINSADRIHAIFDQFPDGNIPKAQATELATAVAGLISGGSPQSQQQINDIVPHSMLGNAADLASWYSGNPKGREQQEFVKVLKESSVRERAVAMKQKMEAQRARLPAYENLRAADPEHYARILKGYGVTEFDDPNAMPPVQEASPQGLVKPQGFLSKLGGLIMGDKAQAGSPALPPPHPQDEAAVGEANRILSDQKSTPDQKKKAQEVLRMNGL